MPRGNKIILGEKHNVADIAATLANDAEGLVKILSLPQQAIDSSGMGVTVNTSGHTISYFGDGRGTIKIHGTREAAKIKYAVGNEQQTLLQALQSQGYTVPQLG